VNGEHLYHQLILHLKTKVVPGILEYRDTLGIRERLDIPDIVVLKVRKVLLVILVAAPQVILGSLVTQALVGTQVNRVLAGTLDGLANPDSAVGRDFLDTQVNLDLVVTQEFLVTLDLVAT
jgi:hypothetical protein